MKMVVVIAVMFFCVGDSFFTLMAFNLVVVVTTILVTFSGPL